MTDERVRPDTEAPAAPPDAHAHLRDEHARARGLAAVNAIRELLERIKRENPSAGRRG